MLRQGPAPSRELATESLTADLVVVGGGMAGVCCSLTAARAGLRVVIVQDRPVLGGNASSEVRLWVLGATSHAGNNNRWAREGGAIDEILVENTYRNPEGNPLIFDTILLEKLLAEPRITLLLNTSVYEASKPDPDTIASVTAYCSQNSTRYHLSAPLFCDASGDGIVGFLAGAAFRMGAESTDEFGEKFAPGQEYGELLGHSLYFYSKDVGRPVRFVPPSFALDDITRIPRFRSFNARDYGCRLWWIEYGGRMDTVHDTERIKWELWKVVYGVWNHIKNSGQFPDAETLTLEWVGHIPGKRESRRFEGDYMLRQQDIVEQTAFPDAVAFGGWSIDLHPADGIFSEKPGCAQWHSKGIYAIPYRCFYSRNIRNLFLAGRIISASHVAFGSSRVMATCAHGGQAVGMAAALCAERKLQPADLSRDPAQLEELQRRLLRTGQHIPGIALQDPEDLARHATLSATSQLRLQTLPPDGPLLPLTDSWAMLLPAGPGPLPAVTFTVDVAQPARLQLELRVSSRPDNHTPDVTLAERSIELQPGPAQAIRVDFEVSIDEPRCVFLCLMHNEHVSVRCSEKRITGVLALCNRFNPATGRGAIQQPPEDIGVDTFEFWTPRRRPAGHNLALHLAYPLDLFGPENVRNGLQRPTRQPNAWVADPADPAPTLTLQWDSPHAIQSIDLFFDTDYDHPMESVLMGHPESVMPFCVRSYRLCDAAGTIIASCDDNHQTPNHIHLPRPVTTARLDLQLDHPGPHAPASLFEIRCYPPP